MGEINHLINSLIGSSTPLSDHSSTQTKTGVYTIYYCKKIILLNANWDTIKVMFTDISDIFGISVI